MEYLSFPTARFVVLIDPAILIDARLITVYTITMIWNETKRALNLEKHGLDFVDAGLVLSNRYRLEF